MNTLQTIKIVDQLREATSRGCSFISFLYTHRCARAGSSKLAIARGIAQRTLVSIALDRGALSACNVSQQLYRTRKSIKAGKNNDK